MTLKKIRLILSICALSLITLTALKTANAQNVKLEKIAQSPVRWTGIAVTPDHKIFVNYPRWTQEIKMSVGQLQPDGNVVPYPNEKLNSWQPSQNPSEKFVCIQAMYVDKEGFLWILDPANPEFAGTIENGPKLFKINTQTNQVEKIYSFNTDIAPKNSYLNDVRIDLFRKRAYITDSGAGAIIVLDLENGKSKRLLSNHPSTKAENITITINGKQWANKVNADGIGLDPAEEYVYYQALTGHTLYRVPAGTLAHPNATDENVIPRIQEVAKTGVSDGLTFDSKGNLHISALEENAIKVLTPQGETFLMVQDPEIVWPDSFAVLPDDTIYFTTSRINEGTPPKQPFAIFKITQEK